MEKYQIIDNKMMIGYRYSEQRDAIRACDEWLSAWDDIKLIMIESGIEDIDDLQRQYQWSDFLSNFVQDLEMELNEAGSKNKEYYYKRIEYCYEMLDRCKKVDNLLIENTRRAIAETYSMLGNRQESDRLYKKWLLDDRDWGWGYSGWSDCYFFSDERKTNDLVRAKTILEKALSRNTIRNRIDVVERMMNIYKALVNRKKSLEMKEEYFRLSSIERKPYFNEKISSNIVKNVARNAKCPCGSGKKYKRCCGK